MATIFNMAGGGGGIHLSVVGGTTKPTSKINRTVWIDTSTTSLTYILSPTRPKTGTNGLVWIKTANTGAEVYVGNTIHHLYSAALYLNGKWNSVVGWVYTEKSGWVQFSKKLVPLEYTAVEYLESTGSQYIITELQPISTMWGFEIDYLTKNGAGNSTYGTLFGIRKGSNCYYLDTYSTNRLTLGSKILSELGLKANIRQQLKKHMSTVTCTDGATTVNAPNTQLNIEENLNFAIFAASTSATNGVMAEGSLKLYSLKFFDEHDELVGYFIPCYRNSDNMAGLWDQVREKFYTNKGTGTFLVGGDIT